MSVNLVVPEGSKDYNSLIHQTLKPVAPTGDTGGSLWEKFRRGSAIAATGGIAAFGFFSGKDKVYAYSDSYKLFEHVLDPVTSAIMDNVFSNVNLIDSIISGIQNSPFNRSQRTLRYIEDEYFFGVNDLINQLYTVDNGAIEAYFATVAPRPNYVIQFYDIHKRHTRRFKQYATDLLGAMNLGGIIHVVDDPTSVYTFKGEYPLVEVIDGVVVNNLTDAIGVVAGVNHALMRVDKLDVEGNYTKLLYAVPAEGTEVPTRLEVAYSLHDTPQGYVYYYHEILYNKVIEGVTTGSQSEANVTFYPTIPIKIKGNLIIDYENEEMVSSVKSALKLLGVDLNKVIEEIENAEHPEELYNAFIEFGVHIGGTTQSELKYQFAFFLWWSPIVSSSPIVTGKGDEGAEEHMIFIQENGVTYALRVYNIHVVKHEGVVRDEEGKPVAIGECTNTYMKEWEEYYREDDPLDQTGIFKSFQMARQETKSTFTLITVVRLRYVAFDVHGEDVKKNIKFNIPLVKEILSELEPYDQRVILKLGIHLTIHTVHIEHLTFWETGAFKILLYVVIVVIVIILIVVMYGQGAELIVQAGILAAGAVAAGTAATIAAVNFFIALVLKIIVSIILAVASNILSKYLGVWGIVIFAALSIALGDYSSVGTLVQGVATSYLAVAQEVLGFVTLMLEYVNDLILIEEEDLLAEQNLITGIFETNQKLLDAGSALLMEDPNRIKDPLRMRRLTDGILYEPAGNFLARSLLPNAGVVSIEAVTNFYEIQYTKEF